MILTEQWRLLRNPNAPELYDIEADPAQRKNLASRFPRIVEELELAYEPFWQRVSKGLRPVPIAVGDPTENPAVLCSGLEARQRKSALEFQWNKEDSQSDPSLVG